uniref:glycosyltransferase family 2 protein n=1 Tax=Lachnoclostridium phocaeense TaxID=1871021 RepID=UPI0026DC1605|nr:glycosyltransferase family 2 protein [Lachnoclostridium phocaeense]
MAEISIIIPCYNASDYIKKCLDSIERQSYRDFDVHLIDDCSSDDTVDVLKSITSNYEYSIFIHQNQVNKGPSLSRLVGIRSSNSKYLAFCDSDDFIEKDFLLKLFEKVKEGNEIAFCNYYVVHSNGKKSERTWFPQKEQLNIHKLIAMGPDSMCCLLVEKKIFENIDFPDLRNGEDMALVPVLIAKANKIGYVNDCLYNYMYRNNSLSKRIDLELDRSLLISFNYIQDNISKGYETEKEFLGIRNYLYGLLINIFKIKNINNQFVMETICKFERMYPNWENNKYFNCLPIYKKIFLLLVKKRKFLLCRILAKIHNVLTV